MSVSGARQAPFFLELQGIVHLPKFLLPQPDIAAGDVRGGVVHQLREFEQCHFAFSLSVLLLPNLSAPSLPHSMGAEIAHFQSVF